MLGDWSDGGGEGHRDYHSLDAMQRQKLPLNVCVLLDGRAANFPFQRPRAPPPSALCHPSGHLVFEMSAGLASACVTWRKAPSINCSDFGASAAVELRPPRVKLLLKYKSPNIDVVHHFRPHRKKSVLRCD
ncbi:hypothetical protein EVAR_25752_1 [Eumeta japonica]|uniref:Uncharacterized protein n=1 Tax=Eumeta variegata TaxID=151549 RepID=A0A4C1V7B1_EUMVA|nr:hypothetical protein EVAR_25752_1 [Eumeta japonica]